MKPFQIHVIIILLLAMCLSGCAVFPQPTEPPTTEPPTTEATEPETEPDPRLEVTELTIEVDEKSISQLEDYPNLRRADLSGSDCYTAIMVYAQKHPEVEVTYTVDLGGGRVDNWVTEVTLQADMVKYETMMENLIYLPNLQTLHLPKTGLTLDEIVTLRDAFPYLQFPYTVALMDQELSPDTESLDMSGVSADTLEQAAPALTMLPELRYVELMDDEGKSALSKQDVKRLVDAAPGVNFHYLFNLFGRTVSTTDDVVEFKSLRLSADDEQEIRDALSIMTGCSALILDSCGLDYDLLDSIRQDYEKPELTWRVQFGQYTCLTNKESIDAVYNVFDTTCENLKYCRKVKYMDLGHNETLTDLSFVAHMPDLEILIASGCSVSDLSAFENCKKLQFLELAYCGKVTDLTPLAGCESLEYLNICYTKVSSLMPLDGLPLKVLFSKQTRVGVEEQKTFMSLHEDCKAVFVGKEPYAGAGWRYQEDGKTYTDIYKKIREIFNYDEKDKILRAQEQAKKK